MKRMIATSLFAAVGAAAALGACGGSSATKPSAAAVTAKLKADPELKSTLGELSSAQVNCFTNLIYKYGDASSLSKYVNGKIKLDDVKGGGISSSDLQSKAQSCVTDNSGGASSSSGS